MLIRCNEEILIRSALKENLSSMSLLFQNVNELISRLVTGKPVFETFFDPGLSCCRLWISWNDD